MGCIVTDDLPPCFAFSCELWNGDDLSKVIFKDIYIDELLEKWYVYVAVCNELYMNTTEVVKIECEQDLYLSFQTGDLLLRLAANV